MIRSMTGFGRASIQSGPFRFEVEVRSVNHRHLDARVRLPRILSAFESEIRARIFARLGRGKVDMSVLLPEGVALPARLAVDLEVAKQYAEVASSLSAIEGLSGTLSVDTLLGLPGVARLVEPELPLEELLEVLRRGVDEALDGLDQMRSSEGAAIARDLTARLERIESLTDSLAGRADVVREAVKERLRKRTEQLQQETGLLDQARLHQEVVIAADRLDVTEEIVRLRSHVDQFREMMASASDGPVGRRLEFLLQELSREANTIGSKASDAPLAHEVVELKTELERIREQVQNLE